MGLATPEIPSAFRSVQIAGDQDTPATIEFGYLCQMAAFTSPILAIVSKAIAWSPDMHRMTTSS